MLSFVPEAIDGYVAEHSTPESDLMHELASLTREKTDQADMLVGPIEGRFLKLMVATSGAKRVLEIGTFTGYSALVMAEALPPDGQIITCDINRESTAIARSFWERSPHGDKIKLMLGRAIETIAGLAGPFDLVFIDADKESYIDYWEACVPKTRQGGVILADNVLWSGKVLDPQDATDRAIVAFNKHVRADDRVESVMLAFRDGITMAVKL